MTVTLTELAELRLRTFVRGTPNPTPTRGIRLAVKDGGCNGYEYDIKVANAPRSDDEVTELGSLKVFVDPKSAPLLDGVVGLRTGHARWATVARCLKRLTT
ncbi:MAG: iron-sulfur cluster assembly accessory protein, partial [Cyanobacteria bacterium J06648_10]